MPHRTRAIAVAILALVLSACASDTTTPGETTPPAVASNTPAAGALDVPVATTVTVTFSEAIDPASVTNSSFTLTGPAGAVAGAASVSGSTATFTPGAALAGNALHTARVTTAVRDLAGNPLTAAHQWSFTTIETTPPEVVAVAPAAGAVDVPLDAIVAVTFSEPVDPATVTASSFSVTAPSGAVPGTITVDGEVVTFTPDDSLAEFTTAYTITLTTGIRDLKGNALASEATSSFTTILVLSDHWYRISNLALGDGFSLDVLANDPNPCSLPATGNLTGQRWRFTDTGAGKLWLSNHYRGGTHLLEAGDGVNRCFLAQGFFTGQNWTLVRVADGGIYRLQSESFGSARSLATDPGANVPYMAVNADHDGQYWRLRRLIPIETAPPTVVSTTPADDSSRVGIGSALRITFSERMDRGTFTSSTVVVTGPEGTVAGSVTFPSNAALEAVFTPDDPLTEFASEYTVVIGGGVRDAAGNALGADHSWSFTTVFADTAFLYRLSNQHLGDDRSLDTFSDGEHVCFMGTTGGFTGQWWTLTEEPSGLYRLTNEFGGAGESLEGGNGSTACELEPSGNFTGQLWTITAFAGEPGNYRFQNLNFGDARSLDTQSGTDMPYMAVTGNFTGQRWKIRRVGPK